MQPLLTTVCTDSKKNKKPAHLVLCVVAALCETVNNVCWGRLELQVVDFPSLRVEPPPNDTLNKQLVRDVDEQENVRSNAHGFNGLCLLEAAGVAIQQPAMLRDVGLCKSVFHHVNHHLIGYQVSAVHVFLGLFAIGRTLGNLRIRWRRRGWV